MDISAIAVMVDNTVKSAMKEVDQRIKTVQGELKSIRKVVVPGDTAVTVAAVNTSHGKTMEAPQHTNAAPIHQRPPAPWPHPCQAPHPTPTLPPYPWYQPPAQPHYHHPAQPHYAPGQYHYHHTPYPYAQQPPYGPAPPPPPAYPQYQPGPPPREYGGYQGGSSTGNRAYEPGRPMRRRACFECGDLDHLARSCPKKTQAIQAAVEAAFDSRIPREQYNDPPHRHQGQGPARLN